MTEFNFDTVFDETMQTHNLDTVVILGHLNPDGDAAGSVMSLAHYIHVNYPQYRVFPYLAKTLERGPKKMVVEDKIFVPFEMPDISGKQYCVIVCDNATMERMIGLEYYQNAAASIVVDHHASNEGYGDVNWTKVSEACAENVYHMLSPELLLNAAQKEAYPNAADYIYLGILHDTGGLARANQGIFHDIGRYSGAGRHSKRERTGSGFYQQTIRMPMIAPFKLDNLIFSRVPTCCTDCTHCGFCARVHHTYHFSAFIRRTDQFCHLCFNLSR